MILLDESLFPLVFSAFPTRFEDHDIDRYLDAFRAIHDRGEPFLHLSDLCRAGSMSSSLMRKKAARFVEEEGERSRRLCLGSAQIADNALIRGAMTAIYWLSPPPYPSAVVSSLDEGIAFLQGRAQEEGLDVPIEALRELGQRLMAA